MSPPEHNIIITEFTLPDLPRVVEIETECFSEPYPKSILKDIYNFGAGFLVAKKEDFVLGYIIFWIRFGDEGHIVSLAIDKEYRRHKIATKLMTEAINIFKEIEMKNIRLEVRSNNKGAITFYKQLGFIEEEIVPKYYNDDEDAVLMKLELILVWLVFFSIYSLKINFF